MVRGVAELPGIQPDMMEQVRRSSLTLGPTDREAKAAQEIDRAVAPRIDELLQSRKLVEHLGKYEPTHQGELPRFLVKCG